MVGMAEVEVDTETGSVDVLDYVAVVDCGTPINPNLARVQTEGGIAQGIGMALWEDVHIQIKVRSATTLLCSIRSQPDRISEISAWISSAVTKRAVLLVPNPLVSL